MSVDSNYNRQFIQIDFQLLDDPEFLRFVDRPEFATYLILRRYIWRGGQHRLGLHRFYREEHKLASSIGSPRVAELLGLTDITRVSKHLAYLQKMGVIRTIRTGRENIYILGEWHTPPGWDVSKEFYYLENRFGVAKSDLAPQANSDLGPRSSKSDLAQKAKSDLASKTGQSWLKKPSSNREANTELNTVNGLKLLPDRDLGRGERDYVAQDIVEQLGDEHSLRFYRLVASKVPEHVIRQALAEIKTDGADHPAKVFTYRMNRYALQELRQKIGNLDRSEQIANGAQ